MEMKTTKIKRLSEYLSIHMVKCCGNLYFIRIYSWQRFSLSTPGRKIIFHADEFQTILELIKSDAIRHGPPIKN